MWEGKLEDRVPGHPNRPFPRTRDTEKDRGERRWQRRTSIPPFCSADDATPPPPSTSFSRPAGRLLPSSKQAARPAHPLSTQAPEPQIELDLVATVRPPRLGPQVLSDQGADGSVPEVPMVLTGNSSDVGWKYGKYCDPTNKSKVKCDFCGHVSTGGIAFPAPVCTLLPCTLKRRLSSPKL